MTPPLNVKAKSAKINWFVWIFPVIALFICVWLLVAYFSQKGPTIHISFEDGANIQAEKTKVRFRGVSIGLVKKVTISKDAKNVIATVSLEKDAEEFAVEGSKFWVVAPKVNFQGVSGLETLFEGTYIAILPGPPEADTKKDFKGQAAVDDSEALENTTPYLLEATNVESITLGDSVTFRGLNIGSVSKILLSKTAQVVQVQINVHNHYVRLVRTNTMFWRKIGIQANLGLFGSSVKVNSLDSIMHGGVELFTPDVPGDIAKPFTKFALNPNPPKGSEKWNPILE